MKFSSFVLSAALIVQQTNAGKCKKYETVYDGSEGNKDMGYKSKNNVTAQARIDFDVGEIADLFDLETDDDWLLAKDIYENGKNVEEDNVKLSIQSLSRSLVNLEVDNIPKLLKKYEAYFGTYTYGDEIVSAGFSKGATDMERGNIDLSSFKSDEENVDFGFMGREEVSKKAMQYLITPMHMHVKLTQASNLVEFDQDAAQLAWDTAVAYFTGTTFKDLVFTLALKRCGEFGTCGTSDTPKCAPANDEIFLQLKNGQKYIGKEKKKKVDEAIDKIIDEMLAPLMQGTLRYAYKIGKGLYTPTDGMIPNQMGQKERAEGYMFVVGALPFVHECSPSVAAQLYDLMSIPQEIFKIGEGVSNLMEDVQKNFAYVSSCTGVTCADIGNMLDPSSTEDPVPVVSTCPYPQAPKHCKDKPLNEFTKSGKTNNCAYLNMLENKKRKKYCKKSSIKKACKYTCKKECVCDDIEKSECKKIYKKKTMKEVVDLCIEEPELQTDCPSACQGWCNKKMRWIEE